MRITRLGPVLVAVALVSAAAACGGSGGSGSSGVTVTTTVTETATETGGSTGSTADPVVRVVKAVEPAVVSITATSPVSNPFFGGSSTQEATGSGFIVSSDGVVFTNDHVVEGASTIRVTLPDGRSFEATVSTTDATHDFAILKIDATGLPTVALGNSSELQLGQSVVAIGYALGLDGGPSVTSGIISSLERTVQAQDANVAGGVRTYENVLQTSAAINPGNSGGPLVDLGGRVVGIDTAGVGSADNIGFAISIDAAKSFIATAVAGS